MSRICMKFGRPDANRPLIPVYFEDLNNNRSWDQGEPRYADDDRSNTVSQGDERLDPRFIEGTTVVANDPDLKRPLKASSFGYDDVNNANGWEFKNNVRNMNFDDGSSETWYLEHGNIVQIIKS